MAKAVGKVAPAAHVGKLKSTAPYAEDAGVIIGLPSGHTETITTDEAENLMLAIQDLGIG